MKMRPSHYLLVAACSILLAACGRAAEEVGAASPQAIERAAKSQPPVAAPPATIAATTAAAEPSPMPAPEALTDDAITRRITTALLADPEMSGADVSINTDQGVVVLSGTVKSHEQTGVASAHAQRQDGVLRVDNNLRPAFS